MDGLDFKHGAPLWVRMREQQDVPDKVEVMAVRLGSVGIVALPGEVFCETGMAIKRASPAEHTIVIELANDAAGYLPTREGCTNRAVTRSPRARRSYAPGCARRSWPSPPPGSSRSYSGGPANEGARAAMKYPIGVRMPAGSGSSRREHLDFALQPIAQPLLFPLQIIMRLQVEPELRRHLEVAPQAQGGVGGDRALTLDDLVDAARWNANVQGEPVLANAHRLEKLLGQDFTRGDVGD